MRKLSVLFTILVLAAMLLIACGAEETSTTVPNTTFSPEVPPVTADTTATDDGTSLTETVVPGTDSTTTPEIPVTGENDPARITNQLDFTVWNQNGEQIGEVEDMVLDLDNTRVTYVIVGTGGFLELGEKDVLVPWNSLELLTGAGDAAGGELNAFILQSDQEIFNNSPDVDLGAILPVVGQPATDWDAEIRVYWESGVVPSTPDAAATIDPNLTATSVPTETAMPEGTADATNSAAALEGVALASDVLGESIRLSPGQGEGQGQAATNPGAGTGQETATPGAEQATATADPNQGSGQGVGNFEGTLDDIIVDIATGDILYLVVNTTLSDDDRWIPVPLSFFQWDSENAELLLNVNPAVISDAPFFVEDAFPDTSVEGWNSEWNTFWDTLP